MTFDVYVCGMCEKEFAVKSNEEARLCPYCGYHNFENRVEELELEINDWRDEVQKWQQFYKESEESHLETKKLLRSILNKNKRYRKAIDNIIEKAMLFGTNEEVYDAIQDAIKVLVGEK